MSRRVACVLSAALMTVAVVATQTGAAGAADPVTETFACTNSSQEWVVPEGVTEATVDLRGAEGGDAAESVGGAGGRATATIAVTPGETIAVYVGCRGADAAPGALGAGGFNGGANGGAPFEGAPFAFGGAGGGGASDIRQGGVGLAERVLVAGGGGGAGASGNGFGDGGGGGGVDGIAGDPNQQTATGGGGATGATGGTAGTPGGNAGTLGLGGDGGSNPGNSTGIAGGGGGGGYAGGGGGGFDPTGWGGAGGGGGSGFGPSDVAFETAVNAGDGVITITYTPPDGPDDPNVSPTTAPADGTRASEAVRPRFTG